MNKAGWWFAITTAMCLIGLALVELWAAVGINSPQIVFAVLLVFIVFGPLEGLACINLSTIALAMTLPEPMLHRIVLSVLLWLAHGLQLGLSMVFLSKFLPTFAKTSVVIFSLPTWKAVHRVADSVFPQTVQKWLGVLFTLVTEICILPAAVALLFATAKLKYAGEHFDYRGSAGGKGQGQRQVLVLIHGNRFNECQWHFPRMLMHARGWHQSMEIVTVNYFGGPVMRSHEALTSSVEGCSRVVLGKIQEELKLRGVEDVSQVVLMGHSLGGVVSAYIKENLSEEAGLPVTNVVAIAAPLGGSALLEWAHSKPIIRKSFRTDNQFLEFHPSNVEMRKLREKMKKNSSDYFAVTGACDPLVRPDSALLDFFSAENKVLIPYLGHYNIKVSYRAMNAIVQYVESVVVLQ